mmetsp:Transcript_8076/g.22449  ORF Transcript_8076/g.22449 Transcript_8076/m.22449 type:complete len:306 (+) Transcript_8076:1856-2773(+)
MATTTYARALGASTATTPGATPTKRAGCKPDWTPTQDGSSRRRAPRVRTTTPPAGFTGGYLARRTCTRERGLTRARRRNGRPGEVGQRRCECRGRGSGTRPRPSRRWTLSATMEAISRPPNERRPHSGAPTRSRRHPRVQGERPPSAAGADSEAGRDPGSGRDPKRIRPRLRWPRASSTAPPSAPPPPPHPPRGGRSPRRRTKDSVLTSPSTGSIPSPLPRRRRSNPLSPRRPCSIARRGRKKRRRSRRSRPCSARVGPRHTRTPPPTAPSSRTCASTTRVTRTTESRARCSKPSSRRCPRWAPR